MTFDNLGEAADLERRVWPKGESLGRHPSVRRALPRILGMLGKLGLRATFFVEGINIRSYPDALLEIVSRDHELGYHGWRGCCAWRSAVSHTFSPRRMGRPILARALLRRPFGSSWYKIAPGRRRSPPAAPGGG